jgi:hypothetical protein
MPNHPAQPTPEVQQQITAFIRAGGFPHVAAEAAGVPRRTFERWMRYGRQRHREPVYHAFAAAVRQASAQARLRAEIAVLDSKPLDWLRYGPGKETTENAGWTAAVRVAPRSGGTSKALESREVRAVIAALVQVLAPHPEARQAVADWLTKPKPRQRRRWGDDTEPMG